MPELCDHAAIDSCSPAAGKLLVVEFHIDISAGIIQVPAVPHRSLDHEDVHDVSSECLFRLSAQPTLIHHIC